MVGLIKPTLFCVGTPKESHVDWPSKRKSRETKGPKESLFVEKENKKFIYFYAFKKESNKMDKFTNLKKCVNLFKLKKSYILILLKCTCI